MRRRLYICIPMFVAAAALLVYSLRDAEGFQRIWRYFAWANQTLSVFTLWAVTIWLVRERGRFSSLVPLLPALLMTAVCTSYICVEPKGGLGLGLQYAGPIAVGAAVVSLVWFALWKRKYEQTGRIRA